MQAERQWAAVPGVVTTERPAGTSFSALMQQGGLLDVARALRLAIGLGEILEAGHHMGLVHGDLSPDNVLVVGDDDRVLLLAPSPQPAANGALSVRLGISAGVPVPWDADIFAFGVILYQLLAGAGPFDLRSRAASYAARAAVPRRRRRREVSLPLDRLVMETLAPAPVSLRNRRREVSLSLERLVMETLGPAPERRPRDISEVVNRLWIERERLRGAGRPERPRRPSAYRPRWHPSLITVPILLLLLGSGWFIGSVLREVGDLSLTSLPVAEVTAPPRMTERPDTEASLSAPLIDEPRSVPSQAPPTTPAHPLPAPDTLHSERRAGAAWVEATRRPAMRGPAVRPAEEASAGGAAASRPESGAPGLATSPIESPSPTHSAGTPLGLPSQLSTDVETSPTPSAGPPTTPVTPEDATIAKAGEAPPPAPTSAPDPARYATVVPRDLEPLPAPSPLPETEVAAAPMHSSSRGGPPPGSEAGSSALGTGHGARGAGGVIEGRVRVSAHEANEQPFRARAASASSFDAVRDIAGRR